MRLYSIVIVQLFVVLSSVFAQTDDETYALVGCKPHWGGIVCDCENAKYVNHTLIWQQRASDKLPTSF